MADGSCVDTLDAVVTGVGLKHVPYHVRQKMLGKIISCAGTGHGFGYGVHICTYDAIISGIEGGEDGVHVHRHYITGSACSLTPDQLLERVERDREGDRYLDVYQVACELVGGCIPFEAYQQKMAETYQRYNASNYVQLTDDWKCLECSRIYSTPEFLQVHYQLQHPGKPVPQSPVKPVDVCGCPDVL